MEKTVKHKVRVEVVCSATLEVEGWLHQEPGAVADYIDQNITSIKLGKAKRQSNGKPEALKAGWKVTFSEELMPLVEELHLDRRVETIDSWEE